MTRWAMVQNGTVITAFEGAADKETAYPDIAGILVEAGPDVSDNWTFDGASFAPPVAASPRIISAFAYRERFTAEEKVAIYTAAAANVQLRIWLDDVSASLEVHLDSARMQVGMATLVSVGLLSQERAEEILA